MDEIKIAIHDRPGYFFDRWIEYCDDRNIRYKLVNCLDTHILSELKDCQILLWHWLQDNTDYLVARDIIKAAEQMGLAVFPNTNTCWSFDNKVAQKYLLESINAPLVPSYVFFDKDSSLEWLQTTELPKVFKLTRGAGARNVKLVKSLSEGKALVKKAFGAGFKPVSGHTAETLYRLRSKRQSTDWLGKIRRLPQSLYRIYMSNKSLGRERGYVYFQDFIPNNTFDTRMTVIGDRVFGFTRNVRPNDFRASGSGSIDYSLERIRPDCVKIAFEVAQRLGCQSIAFDFVLTTDLRPLIVEISYGYIPQAVYDCPGHWDSDLNWQNGHLWPQDAIIDDLLNSLKHKG
jgi:glutathione synthase/RimK-type ligase-like ATP-grasp enzyme